MSRVRDLTNKAIVAVVAIGILIPANSTQATSTVDQRPITSDSSQNEPLVRAAEYQYNPSTSCYGSQTPFVRGVITDPAGQPVAGARVSMTLLGYSNQGVASATSPFVIESTAADGSYSMCSLESSWSETYASLKINFAFLVATVIPSSSSTSTALASTLARVSSIADSAPGRENGCVKANTLTSTCVMNVAMRPAVVSGVVKQQDQSLFPKSVVSLEYLLLGKWVSLGEFESNAAAWFGLAGFDNNFSYRVRIAPPWCMLEMQTDCPHRNLGTVSDNFSISGIENANPDTAVGKWLATDTSSQNFVIKPANFMATLKNADGSLTINEGVQLVSTQVSPARGQTAWIYGGKVSITLEEGTWTLLAKNAGGAIMKDTTFTVTIAADTSVSSIVKSGGNTICSAATIACTSNVNLLLDSPNFMGYVKDDIGNSVIGAELSFLKWDVATSRWIYLPMYGQSGNPDSEWDPKPAGLVGFELPTDSILRVNLDEPWYGDSEVTKTAYYIKTSADGAGIKVQRCSTNPGGGQNPPPCSNGFSNTSIDDASNTMTSDSNGYRTFVMPTANFKGIACTPGSGTSCTPAISGYVRLSQSMQSSCQNCGSHYQQVSGTNIRGDGVFSTSVTTAGKYRIELSDARNADGTNNIELASSTLDFEAVTSGSSFVYYKLDASGTRTSEQLTTIPIAGKGNRVLTRFAVPSLIGLVRAPDGTPNRYSSVSIMKDISTEMCLNCREQIGWGNLDNDGVFSSALPVGRYILSMWPSTELASQNLTQTEFKLSVLDCNSDGTVELYTHASTQCSGAQLLTLTNGRVVITLLGANFAGVLRNPSTNAALPYSQISVMKQVSRNGQDHWDWSNKGTSTSQTGVFALNFADAGRYKVVFNPPWDLQSQYSAASIVVDVTVSGGTPTVTPVADSDVWSADSSGTLSVKLQLPNASGTVSLPSGVTWPTNGGSRGWVNTEIWSDTLCGPQGCYTYSPDAPSTSVSATGDYAVNLSSGRWRLTFNPPNGLSGVAKTSREVVVTTEKHVCFLSDATSNATVCPADRRIARGDLDVMLPPPNYSGTVRNPGTPGTLSTWTSVQFSTWNSDQNYWMWTNLHANTDGQGKFGVTLTENKTYRINFEPAWTATGVSGVSKYVRVCGGGNTVESIATETLAKSGTTCSGSGTQLRDQTITLLGANMKGYVEDAAQTRLGNVWIGLQNCEDGGVDSRCVWERGVNTKSTFSGDVSNGTFDLRLENTSGGNVTKYIIEVNPPWNSSTGLVRQTHTVWVRDFNSDGSADWCLNANYTENGSGGTCTTAMNGSSSPWGIQMTAGNLAGKVFGPTGTSPVANAQIQVEKWSRPDWDPANGAFGWQWSNIYAGANQSGVFGLDIRVAGLYRVSVSPGWDNSNGYARRRYVIRVDAEAKWCIKSGLTNSSAQYPTNTDTPDNDTCTFGSDNESDSVTGFTARVSSSNLNGVLFTSSTDLTSSTHLADNSKKVGGTWIGLMKKHPQGWWEWQGGSSTSSAASSAGRFGFNITEDGEYQLDFNTSWNSNANDAVFKLTFSASNCVSTCLLTTISGPNVVQSQDGSYVVKYLAPNFSGTVFSKDGTRAIAGSWIGISNSTTGEWMGGVSTGWNGSNLGKFAIKLDNGTYRVDVWPRWDDPASGIRRMLTIVVVDGVVTSCGPIACAGPTSGSYSISLMSETLTGRVYYPGATERSSDSYASGRDGNQTAMPWAWAEALSCSDTEGTTCNTYVESQSTNQYGDLKMGLQDSTNPYLVRVYPNYSMYAASPLQLLVRVTAGVAEWKYRGAATYVSGAFNPDFGYVPPNLTVTVAGVTSSRFIDLYECDTGNCLIGGTKIATAMTTFKDSAWKANFVVSNTKSYRIVVIATSDDDGGASKSTTFTYDSATKKFGTDVSELTHTFTI
jgi:protocatechuate 3,4-dioxygenase beta subunit